MRTIYYSRWILADNGSIIEYGAIVVNDNRIEAVGTRSAIRRDNCDRVVNLGDVLVLPGLINMHLHLEESLFRGVSPDAEESFATFSAKRANRLRGVAPLQLQSRIRLTARELLASGTTTILDSSRTGISLAVLEDEPIRSWVVHELHADDVRDEESIATLAIAAAA